ncbi:MAG: SDR family oxidoreductase, partial [Chloroflexi bacterium]|nr:SDR family oxidoreductase [Chloroflexota bacterium]
GGLSNDPTAEYNPKANYEMNTTASVKLAELCARHGVRRYVYASSCSVYDNGVDVEEHDIVQDEDTPIRPRAAYSGSKFAAEGALLAMASPDFCPIVLRKGTVFGYSPRMRYDLVVNTFVKDALSKGVITVHFGGEMWRPLVDVRDAARAYIACLRAERSKVAGQIFNVSYRNFRISELALRVREALRECDVRCEICVDYGYKGVRSYRVSAKKIEHTLDFRPVVSVEESVRNMVEQIRQHGMTNYDDPKYYNIRWMRFLEDAQRIIGITGSVFELNGNGSEPQMTTASTTHSR